MGIIDNVPVKLQSEHKCFACHQTITPGPAVRLRWSFYRGLGGIGYFHLDLCAGAMIDAISEDLKPKAKRKSSNPEGDPDRGGSNT